MFDITTLQLGIPGGPELLIVLVVLILLFGANKIPKLARSTGQAMGEFQRGRQELEEELKEMDKDEAEETTGTAETTTGGTAESTTPDPSETSTTPEESTDEETETNT